MGRKLEDLVEFYPYNPEPRCPCILLLRGKRRLIIPPDLVDGSVGTASGGDSTAPLPPISTLVFDVELEKIKSAHSGGPENQ